LRQSLQKLIDAADMPDYRGFAGLQKMHAHVLEQIYGFMSLSTVLYIYMFFSVQWRI
jgi:hypothetical protein